jgi:hypothetical protein
MGTEKEPKSKKKPMKKVSKGDLIRFIKDAAEDPKQQAKMMSVVEKKGKGETPQTLLEKFHDEGYYGVSLQDCSTILFILKKGIRDTSQIDWCY